MRNIESSCVVEHARKFAHEAYQLRAPPRIRAHAVSRARSMPFDAPMRVARIGAPHQREGAHMAKDDDLETRTGSYVAAGSDWSEDEKFWRTNYASRPYAPRRPWVRVLSRAYRYGHDAAKRHGPGAGATWKRRCVAAGRSSRAAASARGTRSRTRCGMRGIGSRGTDP